MILSLAIALVSAGNQIEFPRQLKPAATMQQVRQAYPQLQDCQPGIQPRTTVCRVTVSDQWTLFTIARLYVTFYKQKLVSIRMVQSSADLQSLFARQKVSDLFGKPKLVENQMHYQNLALRTRIIYTDFRSGGWTLEYRASRITW